MSSFFVFGWTALGSLVKWRGRFLDQVKSRQVKSSPGFSLRRRTQRSQVAEVDYNCKLIGCSIQLVILL
jgi:hypothetical protein